MLSQVQCHILLFLSRCVKAALRSLMTSEMEILPSLESWPLCTPTKDQIDWNMSTLLADIKELRKQLLNTKADHAIHQSEVSWRIGLKREIFSVYGGHYQIQPGLHV